MARHGPGFGDPFAMPIDRFASVVEAVSDMLASENDTGGRSAVDREMRRLMNG